MENFMIIRHTVSDFSQWKQGYDAHEPARTSAGLSEKYLLQDTENPNQVTIILSAEDLKRAEEFSMSDDLREAMQRVGVVGKPDIHFCKG